MNKENVISYLRTRNVHPSVIERLEKFLPSNGTFQMDEKENGFDIHTELKPGNNGIYYEAIVEYDKETLTSSVVVSERSYSPARQMRYGFFENAGIEIFTDAKSQVFDESGLVIYESWFSDENKYYGAFGQEVEPLISSFRKTSPVYKNGYIVESPSRAYQPFLNQWMRYGKTHVYKFHGRSPMRGESGSIGIAHRRDSLEGQRLLSESYGQIYSQGSSMRMSSEEEIVDRIEEIYQECMIDGVFNQEQFDQEFNKSMFSSRIR